MSYYRANRPTTVSIYWSTKASAYAIRFHDTRNWNQMQIPISFLKNIPYGDRDYDGVTKVWYIIEKYLEPFREIINQLPQFFTIDFQEKPSGSTYQGKFISADTYIAKFKELTGEDIKSLEYTQAKKIYRHWMMKNHPDKGGDKKLASDMNEAWSNIEISHYKIKKEVEYVSH